MPNEYKDLADFLKQQDTKLNAEEAAKMEVERARNLNEATATRIFDLFEVRYPNLSNIRRRFSVSNDQKGSGELISRISPSIGEDDWISYQFKTPWVEFDINGTAILISAEASTRAIAASRAEQPIRRSERPRYRDFHIVGRLDTPQAHTHTLYSLHVSDSYRRNFSPHELEVTTCTGERPNSSRYEDLLGIINHLNETLPEQSGLSVTYGIQTATGENNDIPLIVIPPQKASLQ